ncbi:MAG: hypothetical protein KC492_22565, partial [Myxococcales bacterium]|nr:hypothetical protein [Myxococcales bacterium]
QRAEDAVDACAGLPVGDQRHLTSEAASAKKRQEIGEIPVPPKYTSGDFRSQTFWRLRGKLDVPKERFVLFPGAERDTDPTPVVGWAGWDHLQRAKALAAYYVDMRDTEGWSGERLTPLLAGLLELLPWLKQWHDDPDPTFGVGMGQYFEDFLSEELRRHGLTREDLRSWRPPTRSRGGRRKRSS